MTHRPNAKQVNEDVSTEFSRQHLQPANTVSAYEYTIVVTSHYQNNRAEWWNNSVNYCRQNHVIYNSLKSHTDDLPCSSPFSINLVQLTESQQRSDSCLGVKPPVSSHYRTFR